MARPDPDFMKESRQLETAYLESDDPVAQSGFSGGRERWVAERSPLVEALDGDGDFLDVGCANGLLAADVVGWARERGIVLVPHGIDIGPGLVDLARRRLPAFSENFVVADAWTWEPGHRWRYVYSVLDLAPRELWCAWLRRLSGWVGPGGRLIIGSYGSRSRALDPEAVAEVMERCGMKVSGLSRGGDPPITRYAWVDAS